MSTTASRTLVSTSPAATSCSSEANGAGIAQSDPGPGDDLAAALAIVDECAARFLSSNPAVRVGLATDEEREAVFRLRYRAVMERGWADATSFPDGLEWDADDERAQFVVARVGDYLAGAARVILPAPARGLPTEEAFGLIVEPRGRVVNVDRVAVASEFRDQSHHVMLSLVGRAWQVTRAAGLCHCAGIVSPGVIRLYRLAGMEITMLGPAQLFWGEERFPMRFDGAASAPAMARRWLGR